MLGINPTPTARRIALAIRRWFTGRRLVSLLCLIRPISDIYSDIMAKFYMVVRKVRCQKPVILSYFIVVYRVDAQLINDIHLPSRQLSGLPYSLPFGHFHASQVVRRVYIPFRPAARGLPFKIVTAVCALHVSKALLLHFQLVRST